MRVKILTNLGTNDFPATPFLEGEEPEVNDVLGAKLVAMRLAVDITPQPEPPKPAAAPIAALKTHERPGRSQPKADTAKADAETTPHK